jgi:putative tricarboxylic transport membrane protein
VGELGANLVWTALGLYVAVAARDLGTGSVGEPGPGLLAFLLGLAMAGIGAVGVVRGGFQLAGQPGSAAGAPSSWLRTAGLAVALLLYIAALEPVGFLIATAAFLVTLFLAFRALPALKAVAVSTVLTGVSYALFKLALGIQLPAGLLG